MMQALSWALTAAAVLVLIYALRVLMQDADPDKPGQKPGLGCGFLFAACLLWSLAAHQWLGGWLDAFRLGLGLFLITPAIGVLRRPHGSRLFLGVTGLILGIVLAGPVVKELLVKMQNSKTVSLQEDLEGLRNKEAKLETAIAGLEEDQLTLNAALTSGEHADFAALQADPAAMANLQSLAKKQELMAEANDRLVKLRAVIASIEQRIADRGAAAEAKELDELFSFDATAPTEADLSPVEEYARQKELQALFESIGQ